jgi:fluoroquinolone resistance protein
MERAYEEDQHFEGVDYSVKKLPIGDYENCRFINCNFGETNLSQVTFIDCVFDNCNFSAANLNGTSFQETKFVNCKLLGLHFEHCNSFLFTVQFDHCMLNLSGFYKMNLKGFQFTHCSLQEVDFTEADLSGAVFHECNLLGAMFDQTNLEKADLRTATNFSIDPELNKLKKAKFSLTGLTGLLHKHELNIS